MQKRNKDIENLRFLNVVKDVCDEKGLRYDQVKEVIYEIMHRVAIGLVNGKSTYIRGFGSIMTRIVNPRIPSYRIVLKSGRVVEGENKPKMKFSVFVDKSIDRTKNYQ